MIPNVQIKKAAFGTGSTRPSSVGILAILACASTPLTTSLNQPASYASDQQAASDFGGGPLVEYASYDIQESGNPALLVQTTTSGHPGSYGSIVSSPGTSTSAVTTDATQLPYDSYDFQMQILTSGTIGVAGITYQYSLDDGENNPGAVQQLGTANSITIPGTGIKVNFGAGTLYAGATYQFFTSRPHPDDADLVAALEALRVTRLPWEAMLVDVEYVGGATLGLLDTWLAGREAKGQFNWAIVNLRHKNRPAPSGESEAAYAAFAQAATQNDASIRACVGADGADYVSTLSGVLQVRPTALFLAARAMGIPIGTDPAYTGTGPIGGAAISDEQSNPKWHDEDLYPGLDAQRLVTLRTFGGNGLQGVYITNANVLSPSGSDYVWVQHIRTMNQACTIAYQILQTQLSKGVQKQAPDPNTKKVYIAEGDAQKIEGLVNVAFSPSMDNQVTAVQFALSRTDDLSSNSDSTVTGTVEIESLAYLKDFLVTTTFVRSITVGSGA